MTKVKILACDDAPMLEKYINAFIKDKKVVDIKYQAHVYTQRYDTNGVPLECGFCDRVLIIYEE